MGIEILFQYHLKLLNYNNILNIDWEKEKSSLTIIIRHHIMRFEDFTREGLITGHRLGLVIQF